MPMIPLDREAPPFGGPADDALDLAQYSPSTLDHPTPELDPRGSIPAADLPAATVRPARAAEAPQATRWRVTSITLTPGQTVEIPTATTDLVVRRHVQWVDPDPVRDAPLIGQSLSAAQIGWGLYAPITIEAAGALWAHLDPESDYSETVTVITELAVAAPDWAQLAVTPPTADLAATVAALTATTDRIGDLIAGVFSVATTPSNDETEPTP